MPKVGKIKSERLPISHSSRYDGTSIAVATVKIFSLSICFSARSSKSPYLSRWAWASMSMVTPRQREICLNCKAADRHRRFGLAVVIAESKKTDDGRGQIHEHEALFGQIEQHAEGERADADAEIVKTLILRHRLAAALGCGLIHRERHQRRLRGADQSHIGEVAKASRRKLLMCMIKPGTITARRLMRSDSGPATGRLKSSANA